MNGVTGDGPPGDRGDGFRLDPAPSPKEPRVGKTVRRMAPACGWDVLDVKRKLVLGVAGTDIGGETA